MNQIERRVLITYRWWRDGEIIPEHVEALEESAMDRITEMMGQGYTSGELNDNIHMTDNDPEDGVRFPLRAPNFKKGDTEVSIASVSPLLCLHKGALVS